MIFQDVDPTIEYVQTKHRDLQEQMRDLLLQEHFSRAAAELQQMPGWKNLVERLATIAAGETERLLYTEMDPYTLGRAQGALRILRLVGKTGPMTEQELAKLQDHVTLLRNQIDEIRQLLD